MSAFGLQMGPRAPTDPPKFIPQKWVPKWDPNGPLDMAYAQPGMGHAQPGMGHAQPGMGHAQPGPGTGPTWTWDMPNLAWDMPNLDMGHAQCPWSMVSNHSPLPRTYCNMLSLKYVFTANYLLHTRLSESKVGGR